MYRILFTVLTLLFVPFFHASADLVVGQPLATTSTQSTSQIIQGLGQLYGMSVTSFQSVTLSLQKQNSGTSTQVYVLECTNPDITGCTEVTERVLVTLPDQQTSVDVDFSSSYSFVSGKYYFISITRPSAGQGANWVKVFGTSQDNYASGSATCNSSACSGLSDIFFRMDSGASVNFIVPNSGQTGSLFTNWIVRIKEANDVDYQSVIIDYGEGGYTYRDMASTSNSGDFQVSIPRSFSMREGTWLARASYYEETILKSQSTIYFTIASTSLPFVDTGIQQPYGPALATSTGVICDPDSNVVAKSTCWVAYYLFVPSQQAFDVFAQVPQYLMSEQPFKMTVDIYNAFKVIAVEPVATSTYLSFQYMGASTTIANLDMLEDIQLFQAFRALLEVLLYFASAFFVYRVVVQLF